MNDLVEPMYMVHVYTSIFISSTGLCMLLCGYNLFMHGHITCHILPCSIHTIPTASFLMVMQKIIYERLGGTHVMYMVHVYTSTFISSTGLCMVLCGYNLFMHGHITCHILPCYIHAIPTAFFVYTLHNASCTHPCTQLCTRWCT